MNASANKDLQEKWCLKILSKFREPFGECNLKESSNITNCIEALMRLIIYYINWESYERARVKIYTGLQIRNFNGKLVYSQAIIYKQTKPTSWFGSL